MEGLNKENQPNKVEKNEGGTDNQEHHRLAEERVAAMYTNFSESVAEKIALNGYTFDPLGRTFNTDF